MQGIKGRSSDPYFNRITLAAALKIGFRRDYSAGRFLRRYNNQVREDGGLVVAVEVVRSGQMLHIIGR